MSARIDDELHFALEGHGYTDLRVVPGKGIAGLLRFAYTYGLVYGLDEVGYRGRYCFEHRADALAALESWSGEGDPTGPWIKHKGIGIDELNPAIGAAA